MKATQGTPTEALYTLALTTGMRTGELFALHWADVDLDHAHLQVKATMNYVSGEGFQIGPPQDQAFLSPRRLDLSRHAVAVLRQHKVHQAESD